MIQQTVQKVEQLSYATAGVTDGLILRIYSYDELTELHNTVLGTEAWLKPDTDL